MKKGSFGKTFICFFKKKTNETRPAKVSTTRKAQSTSSEHHESWKKIHGNDSAQRQKAKAEHSNAFTWSVGIDDEQ